jgi:hypothetical protein
MSAKEGATNWAELKFGQRLIKKAQAARKRVQKRLEEQNPDRYKDLEYQRFRKKVYKTLSDTEYSTLAFLIGNFIGLCILLSTVFFILETVPQFGHSSKWRTIFFGAEIFFVTIFTVEIVVRYWAYPKKTLDFFKDVMNIIDVISILPFYIEMALIAIYGSSAEMMDLRVLRALRLMRMMKMGRFSGQLQMLAEGLFRSRAALGLLVCALLVGTIFFSVLLWTIERGEWEPENQCYSRPGEPFVNGCSPFESVPLGFWWAITTMTTVGYGDTFPITGAGRVVAGCAMLAGIFCVALPTGILCTEFAKLYDEQAQIVRKPDMKEPTMVLRPKEELELFISSEELATLRNQIQDHCEYLYCLSTLYEQEHGDKKKNKIALALEKDSFQLYRTFVAQAVCGIDSMKEVLHSVTVELKHPVIPFGSRHSPRSPHPSPRDDETPGR